MYFSNDFFVVLVNWVMLVIWLGFCVLYYGM